MPDTNLGILFMGKNEITDMYCPNVFYDTNVYALGEIKVWSEYEKHPLAKKWKIKKEVFEENTKRWHFHYITYFQKLRIDNEKIILFETYNDGDIRKAINMDCEEFRTYTYEGGHIHRIKEYINFKKEESKARN